MAYPRLNRHEKSDKDIADWRPPDNACWFAERVRAVKAKYALTMDGRERKALESVLAGVPPSNGSRGTALPRRLKRRPFTQVDAPEVQRSLALKVFTLCVQATDCHTLPTPSGS